MDGQGPELVLPKRHKTGLKIHENVFITLVIQKFKLKLKWQPDMPAE